MKIVVSAMEPGLEAKMDPRFGRALWLVIYDTENKTVENIDNTINFNAPQGAGIKTAELVAQKGCAVVITGHLGPKAFKVLDKTNIKGYLKSKGTIKEAIEDFQEGKLKLSENADVVGHW